VSAQQVRAPDLATIGGRLAAERRRLGLSQTAMAALAGFSKSAQIKWERGSSSPTADALAAFATADADVLYIVEGRRTPPSLATWGGMLRSNAQYALAHLDVADRRHLLLGMLAEELRG
jgi:transcriptional regulator with XRE-family HTH domain